MLFDRLGEKINIFKYIKLSKNRAYNKADLYIGALSECTTANNTIHRVTHTEQPLIARELSPKEIKKYLKSTYGEWADRPRYLRNAEYNGTKFFEVISINKIIPQLSNEDFYTNGISTQSFDRSVSLALEDKTNLVPKYVTREQIRQLEIALQTIQTLWKDKKGSKFLEPFYFIYQFQ